MLNIGINGWFLQKPYTGIGQHTKNLIKELLKLNITITIVVPAPVNLEPHKNLLEIVLRPPSFFSAGMQKNYFEHILVPTFFKKNKVELLHIPYPAVPLFKGEIKVTTTIHDIIPWKFPEYQQGLLSRFAHWLKLKTLEKADYLIFVSKFSKQEFEDFIKKPPNIPSKIIHNSADEIFKEKSSTSEIEGTKRKYAISKPYLLYVGGYDKRKNVDLLLSSFEEFKNIYDLVLIGGRHQDTKLYTKFQKNIGIKTGFIDEVELKNLYQGAECLINFSNYEGFNIPLLEAAFADCPVLCSDIQVHREVLGENYPGFFACNEKGIKDSISKLSDQAFVDSLKKNLAHTRNQYDYSKMAVKTLEIFESIANLKP